MSTLQQQFHELAKNFKGKEVEKVVQQILESDLYITSEFLNCPNIQALKSGNKYYIRGYCRDKWGLFYSEIQEVEVFDVPTNSRVDIPLEDALGSIDIDEDLTYYFNKLLPVIGKNVIAFIPLEAVLTPNCSVRFSFSSFIFSIMSSRRRLTSSRHPSRSPLTRS